MINYLKHTAIDKNRWDNCISSSLNRRIYAFSWYLDMVSPGWDALVEDDYTCVFPLTQNRKWAISYLYQPYFAQQLGIFSANQLTKNQVNEFISAIPSKFSFVEIHLNSMNNFNFAMGESSRRVNHEMDIAPAYEILAGRYAQNARRNIRKAVEMGIHIGRMEAADELIGLFRDNFGKKEGKLHVQHYDTLLKIILYCQENNKGYIFGARTKTGTLSAAAFFLTDLSRVYFLFAASAPEARENGAMFLLIDHFIADNAGKGFVLDFEGGNDPNLGRFYRSFGAAEVPYPGLRINRLSKMTFKGLYFARKLRRLGKIAKFVRV